MLSDFCSFGPQASSKCSTVLCSFGGSERPQYIFGNGNLQTANEKTLLAECTLSRESCQLLAVPGNVISPFVIPRFDLLTIRRCLSSFRQKLLGAAPTRASTTSPKSEVKCTFRATSYARKQHLRTSDNSDSWISLAPKIANFWETTPATRIHSQKHKTPKWLLQVF